MTVQLFPGAKLSAEVLLHQVLDNLPTTDAVVIIRVNSDDTHDVLTSSLTMGKLAFSLVTLQHYVFSLLNGTPPERTILTPPKEPA